MKKAVPYRLPAGIFTMPLMSLLLCQMITMQSVSNAIVLFFSNISASGFTYLFLLFTIAFLYGIFGKLWISSLLPGTVIFFITLVSYFKTVINGTPLVLNDLTFIGRFGDVAHFTTGQLHLSFWSVLAVLLFLAAHVLLFFLEKKTTQIAFLRILCTAAGMLYFILFFLTPLFSGLALKIVNPEDSQEENANKLGVVMSLYCTKLKMDAKQEIYSQDDLGIIMKQVESDSVRPATDKSKVTPTVIFLMSESFFDVTELPGITFKEDPLANFHQLEASCTSGKFLSSAYCGNTAYVEMEVLTGFCGYLVNETDTLTSLPPAVYARLPVIKDVFDKYGYSATFLHSHAKALYNRESIYQSFGFDSVLFSDSFPEEAEKRGGYISDMALSKKIISIYEESKRLQPQFLFCVSMENHQPYTGSKFSDCAQLASSELLDQAGLDVLNTYVNGVKDADAALGYLVDYFKDSDEPVMIVFWGDHLPNLSTSSDSTVFTQLKYSSTNITTDWGPEELAKMLSTDYVIWSNYEAAPEADHDESCIFLGLSVLKRLGFELTGYYKWLDAHIYPEMLLYRPRLFISRNGERYRNPPESLYGTIRQYTAVVHDIVYGNNEIFGS